MHILVRGGSYDPDANIEPTGEYVWEGGNDELPAAVLVTMSDEFEPGTWYKITKFASLVTAMKPVSGEEEVLSAVIAEQAGVTEPWKAAIEVGQSKAALMICKSVVAHVARAVAATDAWVRVD